MKEKIMGVASRILREESLAYDILEIALGAILEAGNEIASLYEKPHDVNYKGEIDLVTEADYKSEEILKEALSGVANGELLAEESAESIELRDGTFWIVDPLDGTTNFAHGFPFFAPSVAFATIKNGKYETQIGCVYLPILKECFWAVKGKGAYLNDKRIYVSKVKRLKRALLATGFPYDVYERPDAVISALKDVIVKAQGIRRAGAAAIDLAYVSCGRFDGFWEMKLKPWDTAAGILLVEEAGGTVTDFTGGGYNPFLPEILSSNGFIHQELIEILRGYTCQPTR